MYQGKSMYASFVIIFATIIGLVGCGETNSFVEPPAPSADVQSTSPSDVVVSSTEAKPPTGGTVCGSPCECKLVGDFNSDKRVDEADFTIFRLTYGLSSTSPGYLAAADFDHDGTVSASDFNVFRQNYGTICCDLLMGDFNSDRKVDEVDFTTFRLTFGLSSSAPGYLAAADFNHDGTVSAEDFNVFRQNYGLRCVCAGS